MGRLTQQRIIEVSKGKEKVYVLAFNNDGRRVETCGCLSVIHALPVIAQHLQIGRNVVIMDDEGESACSREENIIKRRIEFKFALRFARTICKKTLMLV